MATSADNRTRIISSGLSVFGWYTRPDADGISAVHVDVGFSVGKFGGLPHDQIEFELRLKRAEVVVLCGGGSEHLVSSIARAPLTETGRERYTVETSKEASARAGGVFSTSATPSLEFGASAGATVRETAQQEVERALNRFIVRHLMTPDRFPAWEVRPNGAKFLDGNPWDSLKSPRIKFRCRTSSDQEEPYIRVEVRCRGEDLDFCNGIRVTGEKNFLVFRRLTNRDVNRAAAEQYLKEIIAREGLNLCEPFRRFGQITIADVILTME